MFRLRRVPLLSHRAVLCQAYHPRCLNTHSSMTSLGPDWKRIIPTDATIPPYSVFTKPVEKSPRDEREYRIIQLENGLKATLIHDIETDKAAASLDVAVGHLHDPVCLFEYVFRTSCLTGSTIARRAWSCSFLRASFVYGTDAPSSARIFCC